MQECVRKPNYVYMFPGSKYQQRIDVGKCVGQCTDNSSLGKANSHYTNSLFTLLSVLVYKHTTHVRTEPKPCIHLHVPIYPTTECVASRVRYAAINGPNGKYMNILVYNDNKLPLYKARERCDLLCVLLICRLWDNEDCRGVLMQEYTLLQGRPLSVILRAGREPE